MRRLPGPSALPQSSHPKCRKAIFRISATVRSVASREGNHTRNQKWTQWLKLLLEDRFSRVCVLTPEN